jgi:signal peptidase I
MKLISFRRLVSLALTATTVFVCFAWVAWLRPIGLKGSASYVMVSGTSMEPTYHTGDLVISHRKSDYEVGDVIVFQIPAGEPGAGAKVIHRIVGGDAESGFITQGDNRTTEDIWRTLPKDIIGEEWAMVPAVGHVFPYFRSPTILAVVAGMLTFALVMEMPADKKRKKKSSEVVAEAASPS